jgi:hypothetical protein
VTDNETRTSAAENDFSVTREVTTEQRDKGPILVGRAITILAGVAQLGNAGED